MNGPFIGMQPTDQKLSHSWFIWTCMGFVWVSSDGNWSVWLDIQTKKKWIKKTRCIWALLTDFDVFLKSVQKSIDGCMWNKCSSLWDVWESWRFGRVSALRSARFWSTSARSIFNRIRLKLVEFFLQSIYNFWSCFRDDSYCIRSGESQGRFFCKPNSKLHLSQTSHGD